MTVANGIVTAEEKNDNNSQAMVHRIAGNWPSLGTRRDVESEPVSAFCNLRIYQTQP